MVEVKLRPHSNSWKRLFQRERSRLRAALGAAVLDIHQVGSTAIPGIAAKPILDVLVVIRDYRASHALIPKIERLGYQHQGANSELRQHYFVKGTPRGVNLYLVEKDSRMRKERLVFRDYLIFHPWLARAYEKEKKRLAAALPNDLDAYQQGKGEFVQEVLEGENLQRMMEAVDYEKRIKPPRLWELGLVFLPHLAFFILASLYLTGNLAEDDSVYPLAALVISLVTIPKTLQSLRAIQLFRGDVKQVQGQVLAMWIDERVDDYGHSYYHHFLRVKFAANGKPIALEAEVGEYVYRSVVEGDRVNIRYAEKDPRVARIGDE